MHQQRGGRQIHGCSSWLLHRLPTDILFQHTCFICSWVVLRLVRMRLLLSRYMGGICSWTSTV